jgi:hypothetical protein
MPIQGDSRLTFALERPGASADQGVYAGRIELSDVKARFQLPDFSAEYRHAGKFGYVELAGILRSIKWEDQGQQQYDLGGSALGWGLNLSTNLNLTKTTIFRGAVVYGEGIQNYMNDAPVDIGIQKNPGNVNSPIKGVALPMVGVTAFIDQTWNEKFSTAIGYSMINIDNSDGMSADAFKKGNYVAANLMYYPVKNAMCGIEFQYGDRSNFKDGWNTSIAKVQFSFKYNFSQVFYKSDK